MRVAILNRMRSAWPGGDLVAIDAATEALRRYGVDAEYAPEGWDLDWLRSHDLVHIFHMNFGWSLYNFDRVMVAGVPFVLTPVFYPDVSLGATTTQMREMLYYAQVVMPFSNRERVEMLEVLEITPKETFDYAPMLPVPNGTDPMFHHPNVDPQYVPNSHRAADGREGVLCVSAREGDKNTDVVAAVCRELGMPFQCVTGNHLTRTEIADAYKHAKVFVNASSSERMSLTTGEALCAGCRVIDTPENRGAEWYGPELVARTDYKRVLVNADLGWVDCESATSWSYDPNDRARKLTWDLMARQLRGIYQRAVRRAYR